MDELVARERKLFHVADYIIFGLTVAISSGIGVYFAAAGGRQKTTSEYLVGNRKMKIGPVALSLIASFESSIIMLGFPAEVYSHGTQFWMVNFGIAISFIVIAQVFVPLIHPLGLTSSYEYLEQRYNSRTVRLLGSVLGILFQTFYMGVVLFGPATALEAVTGFSVGYSVILVAAASIFYTALGGIKAVIWTDALQVVIMVGGILAVIFMGSAYVGGFGQMWKINVDGGRVKFFDFDPNPLIRNTFWTLVVASIIKNFHFGFNQSTVQRIASVETLSKAKIIVLLAAPGFLLVGTLTCLEGMISYAYFAYTECDPFGAKLIQNPNQVLPFVVMELFHGFPGLPGLFLASLVSASLSTLSSCLSSVSAIAWTDFLQPRMENASEMKATIAAKIVVALFGGLSIGMAFMIMFIRGPLQQVSNIVFGSVLGPLTGMFIAGCFFPFANSVGAVTGAVVSFALTIWLSLGASFSPYTLRTPYLPPAPTHNCYINGTSNLTGLTTSAWMSINSTKDTISGISTFYSISYLYFGVIGLLTSVLIAMVVSGLTGGCRTADKVDRKYIVPMWDNMCCCFPESCRRKLGFKGHRNQAYHRGKVTVPRKEQKAMDSPELSEEISPLRHHEA